MKKGAKGEKAKRAKGGSVRLGNCMRAFGPPHPKPLPPKRVERV